MFYLSILNTDNALVYISLSMVCWMIPQILRFWKWLATNSAWELPFSSVDTLVSFQVHITSKLFLTYITGEILFTRVGLLMFISFACYSKRFVTLRTWEWFFPCVSSNVWFQILILWKHFVAVGAWFVLDFYSSFVDLTNMNP